MKKMLTLVTLLAVWMLCACQTMEGLGKDLQKLGDKIEDSAKK